ncbi:hypothetical protein R83H12_01798 [Fibrobacteria bacterium R8-3-H12]
MKKIAAATLAIIAISLASCGSSYDPAMVSGFLSEQVTRWINAQNQYAAKNAKVGSDAEIGYKFESANKEAGEKVLGSYFKQETVVNGNLATWQVTATKDIGDCKNGIWTIIHNAGNPANPRRIIVSGENCDSLLPNICTFASSGKCGMEEIIAKDPSADAKAELEAAANKWIKELKAASNTDNFTFKANGGEGGYSLKATSKVKIGDCPAKSVWEIGYEGCDRWNNVPKKCDALTPKVITDYKGESPGC